MIVCHQHVLFSGGFPTKSSAWNIIASSPLDFSTLPGGQGQETGTHVGQLCGGVTVGKPHLPGQQTERHALLCSFPNIENASFRFTTSGLPAYQEPGPVLDPFGDIRSYLILIARNKSVARIKAPWRNPTVEQVHLPPPSPASLPQERFGCCPEGRMVGRPGQPADFPLAPLCVQLGDSHVLERMKWDAHG